MYLHFGLTVRRAVLLLLIVLPTAAVNAQTGGGVLRGKIVDQAGALVSGATVTIVAANAAERTVQTADAGEFTIANLAAGKYVVRAVAPGFTLFENPQVEIVAGKTASLDINLSVTVAEEVTVNAEQPINTDPEANASATVLREKDIEALPDNQEELAAALQALAGPAAGPNGGEVFIDGFSGGRLPPRDTIREIRINQNPFSSEYDRLGFGRVEILTKPGTDKLRGEVEFEFEDESLNSRNPFAQNRASFQVRNFSGNVGGPIIKSRASYFIDLEREGADNNSLINARILDPNLNLTTFQFAVLTPARGFEFSPRFDFKINDTNTLVARYFYENSNQQNAGLGGFDLVSRAFTSADSEHTIRLTETAVISGSIINEARFQFIRRQDSQESANDLPTVRVLDAFTGGGANIGLAFSGDDRLELQNYTAFSRGRHSLKFGVRLRRVALDNSSPSNFAGTFTFTSLNQYLDTINNLPGARPTQFSIAGGDPLASVSQTDVGVFAQDDWRVRPELTLSFGLRYENQTNIKSNFNLAPRFGFAYAPGAQNKPKTVFRGGFGVFYDRFGESLILQARRFNGINQQQFVVTDATAAGQAILNQIVFTNSGGATNIPSIQSLAGFAQSQTTRTIARDLQSPYTMQTALSVERQLPFKTTFSATFVNASTRRLLRSRNVNAPLNGVRPNQSAGNIFEYESTGRFNQQQLILNARTNFIDDVSIFGNYAFGRARSDSDGAGTFPANSYDLTGEYADALLDVRHRFVIGGNFTAPFVGVRLSPFVTFRSGVPFNITTGADTNGDTVFAERPAFATDLNRQCNFGTIANPNVRSCVAQTRFGNLDLQPLPGQTIVPRNYGRGPEFFVVNLRATKEFGFGKKSGAAAAGTNTQNGSGGNRGGLNSPFGSGGQQGGGDDDDSPYNIELAVQIRNLFNRTNGGAPIGNLRSTFFGEPVSLAGGFGFGGGGNQAAGNRRIEFEIQFSF